MTASEITSYQQEFIHDIVRANVLKFGEFVTKSGRSTPYFINMGDICGGEEIKKLGEYYAHTIMDRIGEDFDNLYGPAYKGIPLVVSTAAALHDLYGKKVTFTFNRKEIKDHGERGALVGHQYIDSDRVIILEDVITAGTSIYESIPLIKSIADVDVKGVIVSVDREERGKTAVTALNEIQQHFDIHAFGIVTINQIITHLHNRKVDEKVYITDEIHRAIRSYLAEHAGR